MNDQTEVVPPPSTFPLNFSSNSIKSSFEIKPACKSGTLIAEVLTIIKEKVYLAIGRTKIPPYIACRFQPFARKFFSTFFLTDLAVSAAHTTNRNVRRTRKHVLLIKLIPCILKASTHILNYVYVHVLYHVKRMEEYTGSGFKWVFLSFTCATTGSGIVGGCTFEFSEEKPL